MASPGDLVNRASAEFLTPQDLPARKCKLKDNADADPA